MIIFKDQTLCLKAYAKLNLALEIKGRISDNSEEKSDYSANYKGYHLIKSLLVNISLHDLIKLRLNQNGKISLLERKNLIPKNLDNTAIGAAYLIFKEAGLSPSLSNSANPELNEKRNQSSLGLEIEIEKNIPLGSGMGGGSADAAAVFIGLNKMLNLNLLLSQLQILAQKIGADVPFFLSSGAALVEGIGEKITPLEPPKPPIWFTIAWLPEGLSTKQVYQNLQPSEWNLGLDWQAYLSAFKNGDLKILRVISANSLEKPAFRLLPELLELKHKISEISELEPRLTGSGNSLYCIADNENQAQNITQKLNQLDTLCTYASTIEKEKGIEIQKR